METTYQGNSATGLKEAALRLYRAKEEKRLEDHWNALESLLRNVLHYTGKIQRCDFTDNYGGITRPEVSAEIEEGLLFISRQDYPNNLRVLRLVKRCARCGGTEIEIHRNITNLEKLGEALHELEQSSDVCFKCNGLPEGYRYAGALVDAFNEYLTRFLIDRGVMEEIEKDYD
jgi:hypothetical protein